MGVSWRSLQLYLAAAFLFVLTTQAKMSQYEPEGSPTRHLAKATKLEQNRLNTGLTLPAARTILPRPQDFRGPETALPPTLAGYPVFVVAGPIVSRPPPAGR
jgi:hypothetical protein